MDFSCPWISLGVCAPELAGDMLLTGSGKCFRDIRFKPEVCLGLLEIGANGTACRPDWGFDRNRGHPASGTSAHVMNLAVKKRVTDSLHRVIYHVQPANIISLSFVLPLPDEVFTRELWEMEPERAMTFPSGLGVIPWMVPGQKEIAERSEKLMERYDVILWAQHGLFCSAETASDALG
ncbi:MAG TPA: class II aldolase/adducin family protein [Candidatus Limiplasma sp.]|nr:class II aldolase/adducin family protein [Candidatus Limiplasma sp.]